MKPKAKRVPTASSAIISKLAPQRNNVAELCTKHNLIAHPHARGLANCNVPDFEPSGYQGLKKNCGRKPSKTALKQQAVSESGKVGELLTELLPKGANNAASN
jgi:hypothetical protein